VLGFSIVGRLTLLRSGMVTIPTLLGYGKELSGGLKINSFC
jgi:hypothetical protein